MGFYGTAFYLDLIFYCIAANMLCLKRYYKTEMRTLILSAVLYLLGIAILLLLRPQLMFHKDGSWKEFGTLSEQHTIFPFWLACIVWAIVSYIITLLVVGEYVEPAASVPLGVLASASLGKKSPENLVEPLPIRTKGKRKNIIDTSLVGYHMLNKEATEESGTPQYIYVGDKPLKKPGYYMLKKPEETTSNPKYTYVGNDTSSEEE